MIATEFFFGQGLGNQLFCYVVSKSLSFDKKMDHVTFGNEFFGSPKWNSFGLYFINLQHNQNLTPKSDFITINENEKDYTFPILIMTKI